MKKTKIAFCVRDMRIGGVESVLIRTLEELIKNKDLELCVITYVNIREPLYLDWFARHPQVRVYTLYPCKWLGTNLAHFFLWRLVQHSLRDLYRWTLRTFRGFPPANDIDILVDYYNFQFAPEFAKTNKPKLVWWHASSAIFTSGNYVKYIPDYDMMVALTDDFVAEFKNLYPDHATRITRIYNPIDINAIQERAAAVPMVSGKYFCHVSRLYADKDIPTLLHAFDMFWNENNRPDVKLYIIGDGSFRQRYEQIAREISAANNIVFTGALPNPYGYMRGALANILSSRSEGLPTVLMESAAVNTLNISSECKNGPNEILFNGGGGMLYTPGDVAGLARCMTDVFRGTANVDKMVQVAHDGLRRFSANEIGPQIIKLAKSYL